MLASARTPLVRKPFTLSLQICFKWIQPRAAEPLCFDGNMAMDLRLAKVLNHQPLMPLQILLRLLRVLLPMCALRLKSLAKRATWTCFSNQ